MKPLVIFPPFGLDITFVVSNNLYLECEFGGNLDLEVEEDVSWVVIASIRSSFLPLS